MKQLFLYFLLLSPAVISAQKLEMLTAGTKTSIRGLSAVSDRVIWVSGSNGFVGKSIDSGKSWKWRVVKGFEKRDFRDIEAFDAATAVIMAVAEPANILKTTDGGETWKIVYENTSKGRFLVGRAFWTEERRILVGNPMDGRFFVARTFVSGDPRAVKCDENIH